MEPKFGMQDSFGQDLRTQLATDFRVSRRDILQEAEQARHKSLSHSPMERQSVYENQSRVEDDVARNLKFKNKSTFKTLEYEEAFKNIQSKEGFLWAFGRNKDGELGIGSSNDSSTPISVQGFDAVKSVSSGSHHTVLVTKNGEVFSCGSFLHGKLGLPSQGVINVSRFTKVRMSVRVKQVACGDYHTLSLTDDGKVYAWGGSLHKKTADASGNEKSEPRLVQSLQQVTITQISCGDFHSVALDQYGAIYSWGGGGQSYNKGQCGHGHTEDVDVPQIVQDLKHRAVKQVSAGGFHTLALCDDNQLFAWGSGTFGELGSGDQKSCSRPKAVKMPSELMCTFKDDERPIFSQGSESTVIQQISTGGHHSLVLTDRGLLYSFGYGAHGQLGQRNTLNQLQPLVVRDLVGKPLKYIAAGWNHSLVLCQRGDLYTSGYGKHGQLGLDTDSESRTAFQNVGSIGDKNVYRIFAGGNHSWVVIDDIIPCRSQFRAPSPVPNFTSIAVQRDQRATSKGPYHNNKHGDNSLLQSKRLHEVQIQVQTSGGPSDTTLCHRFINFETQDNDPTEEDTYLNCAVQQPEQVDAMIQDFVKIMKQIEGKNSIVYVKSSCDLNEYGTREWTVCLLFDPKKCNLIDPALMKKPLFASYSKEQIKETLHMDKEVKVLYTESQLLTDPLQLVLSKWAFKFVEKLGGCCTSQPRFLELRPSYLFN